MNREGDVVRILVAEDHAILSMYLEDALDALGVEVVGPAATVEEAMQLAASERGALHGALLDVNLGGESVFPVADRLRDDGCPIAFLTGYGREGVSRAYADIPVLSKPCGLGDLQRVVLRFSGAREGSPGGG